MRKTINESQPATPSGIGPMPYFMLALGMILFLWWASRPQHSSASSPSNAGLNLPAGEITSSGLMPSVPNTSLTPGDVLTTDVKTICTPGYTKTVRNVPSSVKHAVYNNYGIPTHKPGDYEVDHLISLELGGSNSIRNLWPESFVSKPLNAHVKDDVENKLHQLICSGQISVQAAQQAIAQNWPAAYQKYVGPLPR